MRKFAVVVALGLAVGVNSTDEGAHDYRHHTMEAIGGHMSALGDIVRGKVPHKDHLSIHANALADLASVTDTLFPEGSGSHEATQKIWEEPEEFAARVSAFKKAAAELKEVVDSGRDEDLMAAVRSVGQACKACHDDYRE